jgi:CubicO group peptidase (beta-lactamase class C family)
MKKWTFYFLALCMLPFLSNCSTDGISTGDETGPLEEEPEAAGTLYFPPNDASTWETVSPQTLQWNANAEDALYQFLQEKDTKAFIILKDGKIAVEWYFGDFKPDRFWYWASAGKTLTAYTAGIAQAEGLFELTDKTSDYLGEGWTSAPAEKEALITIWNQLTMTAGLDDTQGDCNTPDCLTYVADAGTRWGYHNAPYTLIQEVITQAGTMPFEDYFTAKLKSKIGMNGSWLSTNGLNNVYWSTARSMARFGLLNLGKGVWNGEPILSDTDYLEAMVNTSQELNKSYGYLWWLNGKESTMLPTLQLVFNEELMPAAPDDLIAGLGKNDQKLYVVPSKNLVVVRMGDDTGDAALGPSSFDNLLWERLGAFIP